MYVCFMEKDNGITEKCYLGYPLFVCNLYVQLFYEYIYIILLQLWFIFSHSNKNDQCRFMDPS